MAFGAGPVTFQPEGNCEGTGEKRLFIYLLVYLSIYLCGAEGLKSKAVRDFETPGMNHEKGKAWDFIESPKKEFYFVSC